MTTEYSSDIPMVSAFQPGQQIDKTFLYKNLQLKNARNGSQFIQVTLCDKSGEIDAKKWDGDQALVNMMGTEGFARVAGHADAYNGKPQFIIRAIKNLPDDSIRPMDFLPEADQDHDAAMAEVLSLVDVMINPWLKKLCQEVFEQGDMKRDFMLAPAAVSLHNASIGGLLEHTLKMMKEVDAYAKFNPDLNRDLLVAGTMFHDIGKTQELAYTRGFVYTDVGSLVGHLNIGVQILRDTVATIDGFPEDELMKMSHMILSHHGTLEWGSPVLPMFPEALVLHAIDNLNAKHEMMKNTLAAAGGGDEWSEYNRLLGVRIYKKAGNNDEN